MSKCFWESDVSYVDHDRYHAQKSNGRFCVQLAASPRASPQTSVIGEPPDLSQFTEAPRRVMTGVVVNQRSGSRSPLSPPYGLAHHSADEWRKFREVLNTFQPDPPNLNAGDVKNGLENRLVSQETSPLG